MDTGILYSIVAVITLATLVVSHWLIRKSIAKDAREAVGRAYEVYLEKEWEEELIIEDPRLERARKIDDRFSQIKEMRQSLQLYKHQELRRKQTES